MSKRKLRGQVKSNDKPRKDNLRVSKPRKRKQTDLNKNSNSGDISEENKMKITSKRVTVPLGFFSQGVKSKAVRKKKANGSILNQQSRDFLNENLHALLQTVTKSDTQFVQSPSCATVRRSKRISAQNSHVQTHYESVADYYATLQSQQDSRENIPKPVKDHSLFKEISFRFQKAVGEQSSQEENTTSSTNIDSDLFCKNLEQQLSGVALSSRKSKCIAKIKTLVKQIDAVLEGKEDVACKTSPPKGRTRPPVQEDTSAVPPCLIPPSKWLYKTPASQKLKRRTAVSPTELKPCILHTNNRSKVLVELDTDPSSLNLLQQTYNAPTFQTFFPFNAGTKYRFFGLENVNTFRDNTPLFKTVTNFPQFGGSAKPSKYSCFNKTSKPPLFNYRMNEKENLAVDSCTLMRKSSLEFPIPSCSNSQQGCSTTDDRFSFKKPFMYDEQLLMPTKPDLREPSPLKFYPRRIFDAE